MSKKNNNDAPSRSWFAVFDNPQDHGYPGEPQEICERLKAEWINESSTRSGAWVYSISSKGLHHIHMVLEDKKVMRWSAIKKSYAPGMHFTPTRGSKAEAEDYIYKRGKFEEAGEQIVYTCIHGEIKGCQGARTDITAMYELIKSGCSDYEIIEENPKFLLHLDKISSVREVILYEQFKSKRRTDMHVEYWYGKPGTGKTSGVLDKYGDANVYIVSDYRHPWDTYCGEDIVLFDDFDSAKIDANDLLRWLDIYPIKLPCRYNNKTACYTKVYFTSNKPLDQQYTYVQKEQPETYQALLRRIHHVTEFKEDRSRVEYNDVQSYINCWRMNSRSGFMQTNTDEQQEILDLFGDGSILPARFEDKKED